MSPNISLQTSDSDKYVSYSHYPHPWVYTLYLHAYYIGQALFQLKFGSVHHFSTAIFQVSILHRWNTQQLMHPQLEQSMQSTQPQFAVNQLYTVGSCNTCVTREIIAAHTVLQGISATVCSNITAPNILYM